MKISISILLIIAGLSIAGVRIYKKIVFKQEVSGYLKRAADANTIDLANIELSKALKYIEEKNLTEGYTSILYKTPDEDLSFWYQNLKASQLELQTLNSSSALERTNVLIKLRETLMDGGEKSKVTIPEGIHVFPHNTYWAMLGWLALFSFLSGFVLLMAELDRISKVKQSH